MSDKSHIEWTDATWNPTTGCTRVSPGCDHCYIDRTPPFRIGHRQFDKPGIGGTTGVMLHPDRLDQPLRWKKPRRIFVNSLSDLFHDDVSTEFIVDVFASMAIASHHIFQVLTKRPRRMQSLLSRTEWTARVTDRVGRVTQWPLPNVWLGTSVEDQKRGDLRIPVLLDTPAAVRFLSCEPLLGPVELTGGWHDYLGADGGPAWKVEPDHAPGCNCHEAHETGERPTCPIPVQVQTERVDWVIVGGESGPNARPMHPAWARSLRDQCVAAKTPFFFKQWGEWWPVPEDKLYLRRETDSILCDNGYLYPLGQPHDVPGENGQVIRKVGKKHAGRELDGRTWDEMPEAVAV